MKKHILLAILITFGIYHTEARVHKRITDNIVTNSRVQTKTLFNGGIAIKNSHPELRSMNTPRLKPVKFSSIPIPTSCVAMPTAKALKIGSSSVPESLLGTFKCKGVSYFGGVITGEVTIAADSTNTNKIWISNLVPGASNRNIYAIVASDQKTITIPQGQQIYVEGSKKATLSMYGSSDDINGKFDIMTGVITITSDLWGSEATDGWFELFSGKVTYTRTDMIPPVAVYRQPPGGLFLGLIPETWEYYSTSCILNSPYVTWDWKNTKIEDDVSYLWSYTDSVSGESFTSTNDSLLMDVEESYYGTPKLTATNSKALSSSFILGADYKNVGLPSYTVAGGNGSWLGFDNGCDYGVANQDNGFTLLSYNNSSYYFGTGASQFSDANYESLLVYYDEPLTTLYFEGVNVYLFVLNAPENTPFTMDVVLAEKDKDGYSAKGEIIASKTMTAKEAIPLKYNNEVVGYTLKFEGFKVKDEDGFEIEKEFIETDKAFYLEFKGFNVSGVTLAVCTEEINPSDGNSRSSFTISGDNSIYYWPDKRQTMYFNLKGAAYSYIGLDKKSVYDNRSGGTYEVELIPFFDTLYFDKQWLPDWVSVEIVDEEYSDNFWGAKARVTIDPLQANAEPRYAEINFHTIAATRKLYINQGGNVASKDISEKGLAYATKNSEGFLVFYPKDMKTMIVYSVTGTVVWKNKIPDTGQFQLSNSLLTKGLYFIKLQNNEKTMTIKISQ
jgi:hypothetical protein